MKSAPIGLDACLVQAEIIGVGSSADGKQQVTADDAPWLFATVEADCDTVAVALDGDALGVQTDCDPFLLENLPDRIGHIFVLARDEALGHFDDGHFAAEATVHLREFESDIAAADDEQMIRQKVHLHHAAVRQKRDLIEPRHVRDKGARAGVDENALGLEQMVVNAHGPWALESRMAPKDRAVGKTLHPLSHALARRTGDLVLARLDARHIDPYRSAGVNPVLAGTACKMGDIGTGHQCLGRDAAGVDASAAEMLSLDDGDAKTFIRQAAGERRSGLAGADDDGVVACGHAWSPRPTE